MEIKNIKLNEIKTTQNVRMDSSNDLDVLMRSIKENGLLQPIGVKQAINGYCLVFGFRRTEAFRKLGFKEIPARILDKDMTKEEFTILNLSENIIRSDISLFEEAVSYRSLLDGGLNEREIAARLGISVNKVKEAIQCLNLPQKYLEKVRYTRPGHQARKGFIPAYVVKRLSNDLKNSKITQKQASEYMDKILQKKMPKAVMVEVAKKMSKAKQRDVNLSEMFSDQSNIVQRTIKLNFYKDELKNNPGEFTQLKLRNRVISTLKKDRDMRMVLAD